MEQAVKRVADVVIEEVYKKGVDTVFTLTGGGAMFLNDAVALHKEIKVVCNHHEQACAMGAVAYSKAKNNYGLVVVTTGCGATNTITGLLEAWQDNIPVVFISGQVNLHQTSKQFGLRQLGVQEADIVSIVKPITKYAKMLKDPSKVLYEIQKCLHIAKDGRPGPVWLDIPMDIQSKKVNIQGLKKYRKSIKKDKQEYDIEGLLKSSKRPVILAGNGVKLSNAEKNLENFLEKTNIPLVTTFLAADIVGCEKSYNIGRVGVKGSRAGNFAMQNADLLIVIGSRLSVPVTGYIYENFAREAKIVVIDIDPNEHQKNTVRIDRFIKEDANEFLKQSLSVKYVCPDFWTQKCVEWKHKWNSIQEKHLKKDGGISLYYLMDRVSNLSKNNSVFVSDAGSAYYVCSQALQFSENQKYVTSGAQADMGFTIPATIGCSFALPNREIVGFTGDGSFQTNVQELQTIFHHQLPIKLFVLNNEGYLSIRTTQRKFFNDRFIGTDKNDGVSLPEIQKISEAYCIPYVKILPTDDIDNKLIQIFNSSGPVICEVIAKKWEEIVPTIGSIKKEDGTMFSRPLEDMYPFLTREEFYDNMFVKPKE